MIVKVKVEDLILEIEKTKSELETATGNRARDLRRHLGKLYKEMDAFRRYMRRAE